MEETQMPQVLTYDEVVESVKKIVDANPTFIYPQQEEDAALTADTLCKCKPLPSDSEEDEEWGLDYDYTECDWHLDDDNTCRYVKEDDSPACVLGHYFVKELGFDDLYNFETKSPVFILQAKGIDVDARAQRFLNTMQSSQDQGYPWETAFELAKRDI